MQSIQFLYQYHLSSLLSHTQRDPARKLHRWHWICAGIMAFLSPASHGEVPAEFQDTVIAQDLLDPTALAVAPDGRIFVAEQAGRLRIVDKGKLLPSSFLDITSQVDSNGERGLLGIALDPDFASNQWVYIHYTSKLPDIHNRVSRFTADGNLVVSGSEKILLDIQPLSNATNHNGGAIHFDNTGKLFIAVGDNADPENAQTLDNLKGKLLRIYKDGRIPTSNPFFSTAKGINRAIWALGLRNPFSFAVQPGTDRIFCNDVGQNTWEEINRVVKGANYGWPLVEGKGSIAGFQNPVVAYAHQGKTVSGCAIIGAAFYNPTTTQFPSSYVGDYFYGDFCGGWIRKYDIASRKSKSFATGLNNLTDLQVAADGTLYVLEREGGLLKAIRWNGL